jgi:hypothetical protein
LSIANCLRNKNVQFLAAPRKFLNFSNARNENLNRGLRGYARINTDGTELSIRAYPRNPRFFCLVAADRPVSDELSKSSPGLSTENEELLPIHAAE